MELKTVLQNFRFDNHDIQVYAPDALLLKQWWAAQKEKAPDTVFPYWAQVWPAAKALCSFLVQHTNLVQNKKVLELAAGLGLPSLLCGHFAAKVFCSDIVPEAVNIMQQSIHHSGFKNIQSSLLNWNDIPEHMHADVLLLSDINYEPAAFETLYKTIESFLNQGTTIILSTPQRLVAKPFVDLLLPFCVQQQEIFVAESSPEVACTVIVLSKQT